MLYSNWAPALLSIITHFTFVLLANAHGGGDLIFGFEYVRTYIRMFIGSAHFSTRFFRMFSEKASLTARREFVWRRPEELLLLLLLLLRVS